MSDQNSTGRSSPIAQTQLVELVIRRVYTLLRPGIYQSCISLKTQVNIYSTRQFRFVQLSRYSCGFTSSYPKLLSNSVDIWFCLAEQISGFCLVEQISNIVQLSRYLGTVQFSMYYHANHQNHIYRVSRQLVPTFDFNS